MIKTSLLLFIILLVFANPLKAEGLTLAVEDGWEPFANPDGTGMSVEIVNAAYRAVGIDVELKVRPYARILREVKIGKWIGGFNVGKESSIESEYLFGKERLFKARNNYYYYFDRPLKPKNASELRNGERIGLIQGYQYGEQFFNNNSIQKEKAYKHKHNFMKLKTGRLDAIILYEKVANKHLKEMNLQGEILPAFPNEDVDIYVVFSLQRPEAAFYSEKLDEGLRIIKANGVHKKILDKY